MLVPPQCGQGWSRWRGQMVPRVPAVLALLAGLIGIGRPSMWQDEAIHCLLSAALIAALAVLGLGRARGIPGAVAVPMAIGPPALLLAVSQIHPYYQDRYVLYAVTGVAWLAGSGIATGARLTRTLIRRATGGWTLASGAVGVMVLLLAAVLALPAQAEVRRLDSRRDDPAETIAASLATAPRVWVISHTHATPDSLLSDEDQTKQRLLHEHYRQVERTEVLGYAIRLYVRR